MPFGPQDTVADTCKLMECHRPNMPTLCGSADYVLENPVDGASEKADY